MCTGRRVKVWVGGTRAGRTRTMRDECRHSFEFEITRDENGLGWMRYALFQGGGRASKRSEGKAICDLPRDSTATDVARKFDCLDTRSARLQVSVLQNDTFIRVVAASRRSKQGRAPFKYPPSRELTSRRDGNRVTVPSAHRLKMIGRGRRGWSEWN